MEKPTKALFQTLIKLMKGTITKQIKDAVLELSNLLQVLATQENGKRALTRAGVKCGSQMVALTMVSGTKA